MENPSSNVTCLGLDLALDGPKKTKIEEDKTVEDSCSGIEQSIGPMKKLVVLDLNGLLADIVFPPAGYKPDIIIGRRASKFLFF